MENSVKKYPNVLIVGIDSWVDGFGANTLPNIFSSWNPDNLAVIYTKDELPSTTICNHFYQISENEMIRSFFKGFKKVGRVVSNKYLFETKILSNSGSKKQPFYKRHNLKLFMFARDIIWSFKLWKTKTLFDFIDDFKPDIIFFNVYKYPFLNRLQTYLAKRYNLHGVACVSDDNYFYRSEWYNPLFLIERSILRCTVKRMAKYTEHLLVILPKLKNEFGKVFKCPIDVMSKGIEIDSAHYVSKSVESNSIINMVYTGNLFIGRDKTLLLLIKCIEYVNKKLGRIAFHLDIYSHVAVPNNIQRKTFNNPCVSFKGAISQLEVDNVQNDADIVVFAEALDIFNRNKARLSFSTKLTDYFKNGKCIFAIGYRKIAPIEYLEENRAAIVSSSKKEIINNLIRITDNKGIINEFGYNAYQLGINNHPSDKNKKILYTSIVDVFNNNKNESSSN